MNANIVNNFCDKWSKTDWQDAYALYCLDNAFGVMNKKEYFEFVKSRHEALKAKYATTSQELLNKWSRGVKNAKLWAKKHDCDINGRKLADVAKERNAKTLESLADEVRELQWSQMIKE